MRISYRMAMQIVGIPAKCIVPVLFDRRSRQGYRQRFGNGGTALRPWNSRLEQCGRSTAGVVAAKKVNFASFEDMIEQKEFILVDFYATWCGPCHMMSKTLHDAKAKGMVPSDVAVAKVDTEKYPALASRYQVQGLPTMILFRKGKPLARLEGAVNAADLQTWVMSAMQKT